MRPRGRIILSYLAGLMLCLLIASTWYCATPAPLLLYQAETTAAQHLVVDRNNVPLVRASVGASVGGWNNGEQCKLWQIPSFLTEALVESEDRRYYEHLGVDWRARGAALLQNLAAGRVVRGGSTITEQVAKMRTPRTRTLWARWLEGVEAYLLRARFSREEILEFYLNQVPYAGNRRGVLQAARYYFARDPESLSRKEMLALAVLVRSPSRWDLKKAPWRVEQPIRRLAERLRLKNRLSAAELEEIDAAPLVLAAQPAPVEARHFVNYVRSTVDQSKQHGTIRTTLDAGLQLKVQRLLDERLQALAGQDARDGAVLVVDHLSDEVIAWVNAGRYFSSEPGSQIDAVRMPRQPGSTLKPFLYAQALELGWTPATIIDDSPYSTTVGGGEHIYHNYSRVQYGPVRLREALGNSLNIPAVRTAAFVGPGRFLDRLRYAGMSSLQQHGDFYGEGLALGNGEVSLYELVRAYAALARQGTYRDLSVLLEGSRAATPRQVFTPAAASLIADILSDPEARTLEFGRGHVLELPVQTAVKTGTSSDYRDAWTVGFSHRFTVGVWIGNLDSRPMKDISGSIGPALVLRSVFAELARFDSSRPLQLSPMVRKTRICRESGLLAGAHCPLMDEWFEAGKLPTETCNMHNRGGEHMVHASSPETIAVEHPSEGLNLAMDPRIPDRLEKYRFRLNKKDAVSQVDWLVDEVEAGSSSDGSYLWQVSRGEHTVRATVWLQGENMPIETASVGFVVK